MSKFLIQTFTFFNIFLIATFTPINNENSEFKKTKTLNVKLDHFTPTDERTYSMEYIVEERYFKTNGPIFIKVDSLTTSRKANEYDRMHQLSDKKDAYLVYSSYRFSDVVVEKDWLKYLTFEQQLEDLKSLIVELKSNENLSESKVIIFGCELAGKLAVHMRDMYPDIVQGGVGSNVVFDMKPSYNEYYDWLSDKIGEHNKECRDTLHEAFVELMAAGENKDDEKITQVFRTCTPQSSKPEDISSLVFIWSHAIQNILRFDGCGHMKTANGTSLDKLGVYLAHLANPDQCYPASTIDSLVREMQGFTHKPDQRLIIPLQHFYQSCTQFGFTTSNTKESLLADSLPTSYFTHHLCPTLLSVTANTIIESIEKTIRNFRRLDSNVKNILLIYGKNSFYTRIGMTENNSHPEIKIVKVPGENSCVDVMAKVDSTQNTQVTEVKQKIEDIIFSWL